MTGIVQKSRTRGHTSWLQKDWRIQAVVACQKCQWVKVARLPVFVSIHDMKTYWCSLLTVCWVANNQYQHPAICICTRWWSVNDTDSLEVYGTVHFYNFNELQLNHCLANSLLIDRAHHTIISSQNPSAYRPLRNTVNSDHFPEKLTMTLQSKPTYENSWMFKHRL